DYVEHHEGVHISEILLSGGGVLAPGAATYIEQATARTARTWNPLEGLRVDVNRVDVEELEAWAPRPWAPLALPPGCLLHDSHQSAPRGVPQESADSRPAHACRRRRGRAQRRPLGVVGLGRVRCRVGDRQREVGAPARDGWVDPAGQLLPVARRREQAAQ